MAQRDGRPKMVEQIQQVEHHRNGVGGEPFHVVRFTHLDDLGSVRQMLGIVFKEPGQIAVIATDRLDKDGVSFGLNSWRGDRFEGLLRTAIQKHENDIPMGEAIENVMELLKAKAESMPGGDVEASIKKVMGQLQKMREVVR